MHLILNPIFSLRGKTLFGIAAVTFLIGLGCALFQEINTDDETWFLQVVRRVVEGEVLYKDVYLGITPFSVYCAAAACSLFGVELLVVRVMLVLYFTTSVALILCILKELQLSRYATLLLLLACFAFAHPRSTWGFSAYNPLARMLLLATFWMALKWSVSFNISWLLGASLCVGLCCATKQNVGALTAICLWLQICSARRGKAWFFDSLLFSVVGLGTLAIVLLPTLLQGGWSSFLDYAVWNKPRYIAMKESDYFLTFSWFDAHSLFIYAAPFLLILGFLFSFKRKTEAERLLRSALFIFLGGAILSLYPRPDNVQKVTFVSLALITLLYFYSKIEPLLPLFCRRALEFLLFVGLSVEIAVSLWEPIKVWHKGGLSSSRVPHFKWVMMESPCHRHWRRMKREFHYPEKDLFFLSTHAGFYYLLFEQQNPTPFDIPIHPALGCKGEEVLIKFLREGKLLVRDHLSWSNWPFLHPAKRPFALEAFIQSEMQERKVQEGFTTIFQIFEAKR